MGSARKNRRGGQILILMALLSTTLIILFGMVVGVGHLVQAKINLQNAVDLAAMTGASWQARYLNHVALINYRMRQNYKFTLYDLYVTQSRFNMGFRREVVNGSDSPSKKVSKSGWVFGICQQKQGYMPQGAIGETGEGAAPGTDICQKVDDSKNYIPPIQPSPYTGDNPAFKATYEAMVSLRDRTQQICRGANDQNSVYFTYIMKHLEKRQQFQMQQLNNVLKSFSKDFTPKSGYIQGTPGNAAGSVYETFQRNLISANANARIQFINPPETLSVDGDFGAAFDQMAATHSRPPADFTNYFEVLESFFRIRVTTIKIDAAGGCQVGIAEKAYPLGSSGSIGTFLGLGRSRSVGNPEYPKTPFNVVLRAEVKPKLLFWPESFTPTLIAVAAAKPFGSRVGPPKKQSDYEVSGGTGLSSGGENNYPLANMSFYPGDVDDGSNSYSGMGHVTILKYLYNALNNKENGVNFDRPSSANTRNSCLEGDTSFLCLALAPTLYESLFWTVFPFPADKGAPSDSKNKPEENEILENLFPSDAPILTANGAYNMLDRKSGGSPNLWHFTSDELGKNKQFQFQGQPLFFGSRDDTASSWSPEAAPDKPGRFGYQIKLASLKEICDDITKGGVVPLNEALSGYCKGGSTYNDLNH